MAVTNTLTPKKQNDKMMVEFDVNGMQVKLTPAIVKNYMISGNKDAVTDQEIAMFMNLCKFSGLNPWIKEAYCIKYGSEPATMVVGKEAFQKRAENHPAFDGFDAGIIVIDESGNITYRQGTMKLPTETLLGGYAEVWRKDRTHSTRIEVSFDEYAGRKKDGTLNSQWSKKPATMIRKVALVQALRETFPNNLGGMYTAEEQSVEEAPLQDIPAEVIDADTGEIVDAEVVNVESEPADNTVASALFGK